jgi:putative ABC transport system ATP-binding protein
MTARTAALAPLILAEGVQRAYRSGADDVRVLEDVGLAVHAGELVLLVGPSGSGKTTLLSILAGLLRPDAGRVVLAGERIDGADELCVARVRRRSVGFVFQTFQLFEALSARDNVAEVLGLRGLPIAAARREAGQLLAALGLAERSSHLPSQLSSGQKQRVAIARAFAGGPRVIFGDEPTAALDGTTAREVMELLRAQVTGERCALIVTHDLRLRRYADRVLALDQGRLTEIA